MGALPASAQYGRKKTSAIKPRLFELNDPKS
jgi:hypothetical protein